MVRGARNLASNIVGMADITNIANDILNALVKDLKLRPNDYVYEPPLRIAFEMRGLPIQQIRSGLEHARRLGWLRFNAHLDIYMLTRKGFDLVPIGY